LFELITLLILFLTDNLVWVPLIDEIKQLFGISAPSTSNNAEEEIESDEVESESSIGSNDDKFGPPTILFTHSLGRRIFGGV
jgi:hypothetical protein